MSKYRIKYERNDDARFISHLDLMRTFNRALRRAKAPLEFTQGFNPHIIMTVALPLSVGITSESEYLDVTFKADVDTDSFKHILNDAMPSGIRIKEIRKSDDHRAFKHIETAHYTVTFKSERMPDCQDFMSMNEAVVVKKSKSGEKEENILPDIHMLKCESKDGAYVADMRLNAGSKRNLKPELVMSALEQFQKIGAYDIKIHRKAIYFDDGAEVF